MTPAPISVERLRELAAEVVAADESGDGMRTSAAIDALDAELTPDVLLALLHQLAELKESRDAYRHDAEALLQINKGAVAALEAAERAREEACKIIAELRDYVVNERDAQVLPRKAASYQRELDSIDAFLAASGGK